MKRSWAIDEGCQLIFPPVVRQCHDGQESPLTQFVVLPFNSVNVSVVWTRAWNKKRRHKKKTSKMRWRMSIDRVAKKTLLG
jgi:hypothetical protein